MAKFKVGDKVTDGNSVYVITGIDGEYGDYLWRRVSGAADASHSQGGTKSWVEGNFRLANSVRSTNSVVANALAARGRMARNADDDSWVEDYVKTEIPKLSERLDKEIADQKKSFAYWIDSDVLRSVRYGKSQLGKTSHKDRDKGIRALGDIEKRANSVISQVERIR